MEYVKNVKGFHPNGQKYPLYSNFLGKPTYGLLPQVIKILCVIGLLPVVTFYSYFLSVVSMYFLCGDELLGSHTTS